MDWIKDWAATWLDEWHVALVLFVLTWVLAGAAFLALRHRQQHAVTPNRIFFVGTFLSAAVYFVPLYMHSQPVGSALLNAVQHAFRLFAVDGDYREVVLPFEGYPSETVRLLYLLLGAALYLFAPLLTFGFILSFFKNLAAHLKYLVWFWTPTTVFSELNQKTLVLAEDIVRCHPPLLGLIPRVLIVFTDIVDKKEETSLELIEGARKLGAILFRKDLESVRFRRRHSLRRLQFFLISDDEAEMIRHTESIMRRYDYPNVELRVFSNDVRTELLLPTPVQHMRAMRVNDIRHLIYQNLDANGIHLFRTARKLPDGRRRISAVIVGLGRYGREMLKALTWYCQVDGYELEINAFDTDPRAEEKFTAMCPELMSERYNGTCLAGEPHYTIRIHSGVDVSVPAFTEKLLAIGDATYIFVSLGADGMNLDVATRIRTACEKQTCAGTPCTPAIETVIYDATLRREMGITWEQLHRWQATRHEEEPCTYGVKNFKGQPYNILMTGALKNNYSVATVVDSPLIKAGWEVHWRYLTGGNPQKQADPVRRRRAETTYWQYEYNFYSSIAKAIHERLRVALGLQIPGIHKPWERRTPEEKLAIGRVEHVRWNAFMRTEGYSYNPVRSDLAKLHDRLVPVQELSEEDLRNDA